MASVILSAAGQAAAPGVGGFLLGQAGRLAGGFVDRQVFGTPSYHGPRLDNLQVQDSRYGAGIPKIYGRARVAGQVIWASAINETRHEQQVGGKGGGSARAATQISYTYSVSFAVLLCEGIIQGLGAVWADGKMVFDGTSWASGLVDSVNVYTGTTTQTADGVMEAALGVGNIPAYRGVAYVVFENFQLAAFGNRLPNLTFDVQAAAASTAPAWMGTTEVDKTNLLDVLSHPGAALPIITAGTAADAREIVVFAVEGSGTTATLQALFYNTTSEVPALTQQVNSATFTSTDPVNDVVWAASPDERYVVVQVQNTAASPNTAHVFLFDRVLRQFGARTQISLVSDRRSLHWISSTDMVTQEAQGGVRGLRWYQRQGNTIVDRGFVGVWGAGSATTRYAVSYSNFLPVAGGLMMLTYNATTNPTTLYGCFVSVAGNNFSVGTPFTITSAIPATSGDEPVCVNVEGDEWLLFLATSTQVRLLTFTLSPSAATITRAWTNLSLGGTSLWQMICPLSSSRMGVLMRRTTENSYRWAEIDMTSSSFSTAVAATTIANNVAANSSFLPFRLSAQKIGVVGAATGSVFDKLGQFWRTGQSGTTLKAIVDDVLTSAGYATTDIDTTALATVDVAGYVLPGPTTPRQALAPLQQHTACDVVESGAVLRAQLRGYTSALTVPTTALRAAREGEAMPAALRHRRSSAPIIPDDVVIDYIDPARDYTIGSQRARRSQNISNKIFHQAVPVVMTAAVAKRVAARELLALWAERDSITFSLPISYISLEPGDVVQIAGHTMRLENIRHRAGVLDIEAVKILAAPDGVLPAADGGNFTTRAEATPQKTEMILIDAPLLRAQDDAPGFYVAFSGAAGWRGGSLYRARDGINYTLITALSSAATAGYATTALATAPVFYRDRLNTVRVQLWQGVLSSITDDALLAGGNAALLGDELIQFQNATLLGDGYYELSGLHRGLRGTEATTTTHSVGERFVMLDESTIKFLPLDASDLGVSQTYQAVSAGQQMGDAVAQNFSPTGKNLKPLAPAHVRGVRAAGTGTDLTLTWVRRNRRDFSWRDGVDVALDDDAESYVVQIMNGTSVIREFSPTTPAQVYTAAQQGADWGTVPATLTVRVAQISARVGAGAYAQAIV